MVECLCSVDPLLHLFRGGIVPVVVVVVVVVAMSSSVMIY